MIVLKIDTVEFKKKNQFHRRKIHYVIHIQLVRIYTNIYVYIYNK